MKRRFALVLSLTILITSFCIPCDVFAAQSQSLPIRKQIQWGVTDYADRIKVSPQEGGAVSYDSATHGISSTGGDSRLYGFGDLKLESDTYCISAEVRIESESEYDWQGPRVVFAGDNGDNYLCLAFFREQLIVLDMRGGVNSDAFYGAVYPTADFERTPGREYSLMLLVSNDRFSAWIDGLCVFEDVLMPDYTGSFFGVNFNGSSSSVSQIRITDYQSGAFFAERVTIRYSPYTSIGDSSGKKQALRVFFCLNADRDGKIISDKRVYTVTRYGALIAKGSRISQNGELTLESTYAKLNGSAALEALSSQGEYTAYLYDIAAANAQTEYAFRPYVIAKDESGVETTLYGETSCVTVDSVYDYFLYEEVLEQDNLDRVKEGNSAWRDTAAQNTSDTVYVSSSGSNSANGSRSFPFRTLSKAISAVSDGGTVVLLDSAAVTGWLEHRKNVTVSGGEIAFLSDRINLGDNVVFSGTALTGAPTEVFTRGYSWLADSALSVQGITVAEKGAMSAGEIALNAVSPISNVFHDQGYLYMKPLEPTSSDEITLRIRTLKGNVSNAEIQYTADNGETWGRAEMRKVDFDDTGYYDYFEGTVPPQSEVFTYRFLCSNSAYSSYVIINEVGENQGVDTDWFVIAPDMKTPDWAKGALVYYAIPGSFYNGTTLNDYGDSGGISELSDDAEYSGISRYGGDLKGLQDKMSYIADEMSADILYFTPIWKSTNGVGYGSSDLNQIDSIYGNEQDLSDTIALAHKNGLKVLLDNSINYVAKDNNWFNLTGVNPLPGACQSKSNAFYPLFSFTEWPGVYQSQWGGASFDFSSSLVRTLIYKNKESFLRRYLTGIYNADGWRLDAGADIWGSDTDSYEVLKDIRPYVKQTKSDALLLSENGYYNHMRNRSIDARWNMDLMYIIRSWISGDGTVDQNSMAVNAVKNIDRMPRQTALCSQNYYENHDFERMYDGSAESKSRVMAARLLVTNTVGSSWIYYGAENGTVTGDSRWNAFNWNESQWDYDFYTLQKALGELHHEYSALKTGVLKNIKIDNTELLYGFGRLDENGAVITVTNQKTESSRAEINARDMSISDGTVITDYLTGREYTVANGKINADIMPGGTVLVTGKSGVYRGRYTLRSNASSVCRTGFDSFSLTDSGMLGGFEDSASFALTPLYGNTGISANIGVGEIDKAVLALRSSDKKDAAEYLIESGKYSSAVYVRSEAGQPLVKLASVAASNDCSFKIVRGNDSIFRAYYSDDESTWKLIPGSDKSISMDNKMYGGFACTKGEALMSGVSVLSGTGALYDDFNSDAVSAMFSQIGEAKSVCTNGGRLTLATGGKTGGIAAYPPTNGNWTARTVICAADNTADGKGSALAALQTTDDFVSIGRRFKGAEPVLCFEKYDGGKATVIYTVSDLYPLRDVQVQIQRIGTRFTAAYRYNESDSWQFITGNSIFASYCGVRAALISDLDKTAVFDYFCFGDSIDDGVSYYTPVSPALDASSFSGMEEITEATALSTGSGSWSYVTGGIRNSSASGISRLDSSKKFGDFRADITICPRYGNGWAGITFGQSAPGSADSYLVRLYTDRTLAITKGDTVLAQTELSADDCEYGRLIIDCIGNKIGISAGKQLKSVLNFAAPELINGYVSYTVCDEMITLCNYNLCDLNAKWARRFAYTAYTDDTVTAVQNNYDTEAEVFPLAAAQTDFVFTGTVTATAVNSEITGTSGVFFDGIYLNGVSSKLKAELTTDGFVRVLVNGEQVAFALCGENSTAIRVTAFNNTYSVYFADSVQPIYTVAATVRTGTAPHLYTAYSIAQFSSISFSETGE